MSATASSATSGLPPPRPKGARAERPAGVLRMVEALAALGNALRLKVFELAGGHDAAEARVLGFDPEMVHRAISNAAHLLIALLARFELRAMREQRKAARQRERTPAQEKRRLAAAAKRAEKATAWAAKLAEFETFGLDKRYRPLQREFGTPPRPRRSERLTRLMNLALTIIDMSDAEVVEAAGQDLLAAARAMRQGALAAEVKARCAAIVAALEEEAEAQAGSCDSDPPANDEAPEAPRWRPPD
jgi:hypothetical protein